METIYVISRQQVGLAKTAEEVLGFVDNEEVADKIVDKYNSDDVNFDYVYYYEEVQKNDIINN